MVLNEPSEQHGNLNSRESVYEFWYGRWETFCYVLHIFLNSGAYAVIIPSARFSGLKMASGVTGVVAMKYF